MARDNQVIAQRFAIEIKTFFKHLVNNVKDNFDDNGDELIQNTGVIGSVVKLFGQQKIDDYFDKIKEKKLENFGVMTYLKAAITCAESSVKAIEYDADYIHANLPNFIDFVAELEKQSDDFDKLRLYINSTFNPAVQKVKEAYINYFKYLNLDIEQINTFKKSFETGIRQSIKDSFGKEYDEHLLDIKENWFADNEESLLAKMSSLKRVGLQDTESLNYEETFGEWRNSDVFLSTGMELGEENEQKGVISLLYEHFNSKNEGYWKDAITFIVADFGKGKSVFMKYYASILADNYLDTKEGPIPVYFNLNNFNAKRYSPSINRGIIESYLRQDFKIDIEDEYFKGKEFIFLIDSLDESGDLNLIHEVLDSVYKINKNAPLDSPSYKIVVSSRPIDKELPKAICDYKSKLDDENEPEFISLYGFKPKQFDSWLKSSVFSRFKPEDMNTQGSDSVTEMLFLGWKRSDFSAYKALLEHKVLSENELVKPLFAYILYQLLTNNNNIQSNGRLGV